MPRGRKSNPMPVAPPPKTRGRPKRAQPAHAFHRETPPSDPQHLPTYAFDAGWVTPGCSCGNLDASAVSSMAEASAVFRSHKEPTE